MARDNLLYAGCGVDSGLQFKERNLINGMIKMGEEVAFYNNSTGGLKTQYLIR